MAYPNADIIDDLRNRIITRIDHATDRIAGGADMEQELKKAKKDISLWCDQVSDDDWAIVESMW
jgi:hypothetical protein